MRLNFEATAAFVELIDDLARRSKSNRKGVIVGALQMLDWALKQQKEGYQIVAVKPGNYKVTKEYVLPLQL